MRNRLGTLALAAALAVGASGIAFAQTCPPGYLLNGGYCQPAPTAGGVVGGAVGTAGAIAGGAVNAAGAIAGGAVNAAGAIAGGAVGAVAAPPGYGATCPPGYILDRGACYPR